MRRAQNADKYSLKQHRLSQNRTLSEMSHGQHSLLVGQKKTQTNNEQTKQSGTKNLKKNYSNKRQYTYRSFFFLSPPPPCLLFPLSKFWVGQIHLQIRPNFFYWGYDSRPKSKQHLFSLFRRFYYSLLSGRICAAGKRYENLKIIFGQHHKPESRGHLVIQKSSKDQFESQ